MEPVLEAIAVRKVFPDPSSGEMLALDGISLSAGEGEFVAVVGPSGGGKSTLLRLLAGLQQPDFGRGALSRPGADAPRAGRSAWSFSVPT